MLDYELISVCSLSSATMPLTRTRKATVQIAFHRPLSLSIRVQPFLRVQHVLSLASELYFFRRFYLPGIIDSFLARTTKRAVPPFRQRITLDVFFNCSRPCYTLFVFRNKSLAFIFSRFLAGLEFLARETHVRVPRACSARNTRWLDDRGSTITVKAGSRCVFVSPRSSRNRMIRFGRLL